MVLLTPRFRVQCDPAFPGCSAVPNQSDTLAAESTFVAGFGNQAGFTGGGQFGYNWQFNGGGVAGFEADIAWTNQNRSVIFNTAAINPNFPAETQFYSATITRHLDYIGTVRGRLGFLATPSFLLYGTGGLAYGGASSRTIESTIDPNGANPAGIGGGPFSETRVGWTAGAGGEWMFAPNWSAKVEGLYYDLGHVNYATHLAAICPDGGCAVPGGVQFSSTGVTSLRFTGAIARVGVNWHFGGPTLGY
jgi:outer membrane immunogenic protein